MKKYIVYLIRHISTGTVLYVGKTDNFKRRAYQHLTLNSSTKKWLSVVGTGNVLIEEVAKFDNETDALKYEDELIIKYGTIENGYNKCRSGMIYVENPEEYRREYEKTDKRKENKYKYQIKYLKEYRKTDKYRKYHRELQREYSKTDKYRKYQRDYQKDYSKAKKLGISVAEYRKLKIDQGDTLEQNKKKEIQLTINF